MPKAAKPRTKKKPARTKVTLDLAEYRRMLEDLEELECIRAFDAAKASGETPIPFEQAVEEIERSRRRITRS